MTLQGDLATLQLADLVQNLQLHSRSGTLAIETPRGASRMYFKDGAITLLASEERPTLLDDLVRSGYVAKRTLDNARKRRWRSRKPLTEVLVKRKVLDEETLKAFAQARLVEDVCDFLAPGAGAFTFREERLPAGVFDHEERCVGLALPVGPVLFEAARREDHWPLIRTQVPSDALHYVAKAGAQPAVAGDPELAACLVEHFDGSRSVREVMRAFPQRRFEAYQVLAALVDAQILRAAGPEDLLAMAREVEDKDPDLAWQVVVDGLDAHPYHAGLLGEKADLAERREDGKRAAEALKVLAHLRLEERDREGAVEHLRRAGELDPSDTALCERTLELAVQDERGEDAIAVGLRLVDLYRAPGLHAKACDVLEVLVQLDPESWQLRRELAQSQVQCGNPSLAVAGLERFGKKLLAREEHELARTVFQEILAIVPKRKQALRTIELIDTQAFQRRRVQRRRILARLAVALAVVPLGAYVALDAAARVEYARANQTVSELCLIENRRYADAIGLLDQVRASYAFTPTALFDLRRRLEDLKSSSKASR